MRVKLDDRNLRWGVTAFLVILCSILVFFAIYRNDTTSYFIDRIMGVCMPFIYGLVMAYLLCPVYNFTVRNTYALLSKKMQHRKKTLTASKATGTIVALVLMMVVVTGILWMIIPGLVDSVTTIIQNLPASMEALQTWADVRFAQYPQASSVVEGWTDNFTEYATDFVMQTLLPQYSSIAVTISESLLGVLIMLKNVFIAVIICAYFLNIKDTISAQIKKIIISLFKENAAEEILGGANFVNQTFGGFINGKIIDSLIIGCLCFVFMTLFGWEYTLLISCIIGVTNIIPFFGPFIGAIPSALLLLMVDTRQCLWFLVFILCLQQFDGNILGPKILGNTTGIGSFWVLFSVLIFGGLFGFIGMIVGIPIFAVVYAYATRLVNRRLEKRGFSTNLSDYKIDKYRVKKEKKEKKKIGGN